VRNVEKILTAGWSRRNLSTLCQNSPTFSPALWY